MSPSESAISLIVELGRLGSLLTEAGVMVSLIAFDFKNKAIQQSPVGSPSALRRDRSVARSSQLTGSHQVSVLWVFFLRTVFDRFVRILP